MPRSRSVGPALESNSDPRTSTGESYSSVGVSPVQIADDLGSSLASVVGNSGPVAPAQRVMIYDGERPFEVRAGDVVLCVGLRTRGHAIESAINEAARAGASAIVVRGALPLEESIVQLCENSKLALIAADPRLSWERLFSTIQASIGSRSLQSGKSDHDGISLGNMFELATAFAQLIGHPVILEDASFRVLGYSAYSGESDRGRQSAILMRRIPPEWLEYLRTNQILVGLRTTEDIFRLDHGPIDARPRLITSVRAVGELIGIIWVAQGDAPLDEATVETLREARLIAVPHFQRYLAMDWLGGSRRSELLRALIEGTGDPAQAIRALGLRSDRRYCLLALFPFGSDAGHSIGHRRELLAAHLELFDRASVTSWVGNTLYALTPVTSDDDLPRLVALSGRVADDRLLRHSVGVAVGSPRPVQVHLADARAEVLGLVEVYQSSLGPGQVIVGWQSEAAVMTRRAGKLLTADPSMGFAKMTALEKYDASHSGSGLVETLTTYLDSGMNVSRSAAAMHLHHTTMRYRLQRISEISGLDLDDPAERLAVQLHCLRNGIHPRRLRPGSGLSES